MSHYEFTLTRNATVYTLRSVNPEFRTAAGDLGDETWMYVPLEVQRTDWNGNTVWVPLSEIYPGISYSFDQTELVAACTTIGSQNIATAANFRDYLNAVVRRLCLDRWGD